jgi:hypothetical protein
MSQTEANQKTGGGAKAPTKRVVFTMGGKGGTGKTGCTSVNTPKPAIRDHFKTGQRITART